VKVIAIKIDGCLSREDLLIRADEAKSKNIVDRKENESTYVFQSAYRKKSFLNTFYFFEEKSLMLCTYGGKISVRRMRKNCKKILAALKLKNYQVITSLRKIKKIAEIYKISNEQIYYLEVQKKDSSFLIFLKSIFKLIFSIVKLPVYIVVLFLGGALEGAAKGNNKSKTYYAKKQKGVYSTDGGIHVKGGRLPKHMSSGPINYYFDGSRPQRTGTRGGRDVIETNGNLQIFYEKSKDIENIIIRP